MVTPGELESRKEYISNLSDFMEEAESNFNKILQSCGWERKVIMDQFCYNVFLVWPTIYVSEKMFQQY